MILYALLCGTLPFDDENIPNLFKKIKVLSIGVLFLSLFVPFPFFFLPNLRECNAFLSSGRDIYSA